MTLEEQVVAYNDLITSSFTNAMGTVERLHQNLAEISLDVLCEVGLPKEPADAFKEHHRTILRTMYGGITSANDELGRLVVTQWSQINRFAAGITAEVLRELGAPGSSSEDER